MTKCLALILADDRGEKLGSLTMYNSKPAVNFGVNRRIIDFALNNCAASGVDTIGVLSQYFSDDLHKYISGAYSNNGLYMLPAYLTGQLYSGTADAVFKNMRFIDRFNPEFVLILRGDQVYEMDYRKIVNYHETTRAAVTEATRQTVNGARTSRAPMGVYVFNWDAMKKYLILDAKNEKSSHDLDADVLPAMRRAEEPVNAYHFKGYWRGIDTIESLWEANMELLDKKSSEGFAWTPDHCVNSDNKYYLMKPLANLDAAYARILVSGIVEHSILGDSVMVLPGAEVVNSIVMPNAYIGNNVRIYNAIIGPGASIMDNTVIGDNFGTDFFVEPDLCTGGVSLVEPGLYIPKDLSIKSGSHIDNAMLAEWEEFNRISA